MRTVYGLFKVVGLEVLTNSLRLYQNACQSKARARNRLLEAAVLSLDQTVDAYNPSCGDIGNQAWLWDLPQTRRLP